MTVGERLREARERQKVSLHAIAEKTNISVRFLDAIEKNQFEKLPGGIFTRGFIRSYAMQVGLDPDAAVAHFLADEPGERDETDAGVTREREGLGLIAVFAGGLILVALTLTLIYMFAPDWLRSGRSAPGQLEEMTDPAAPSAGSPDTSVPPAAATPTTAASPQAASADTPAPAPAVAPLPPLPAPPQTAAAPAETPKAPLHLVVTPTGRCWVQVSADGQMRVARELNVGERVTVDAAERLHIVAGDAGAFAFELNGRAGRPLGAAGAVARVTIQPATVSQFQVP